MLISNKVTSYLKCTLGSDNAHDFDHAVRVRNWALKIAQSEGYEDLDIVEIAALFHDIGFSKTRNWNSHAKIGAQMAIEFLKKEKLFSSKQVSLIKKTIEKHNLRSKTQNKLLGILRDADMLDMVGAVGIVRTFISQHKRKAYDIDNIRGKLWMSSYNNAYRHYSFGNGAGETIVDQLNFQQHCLSEMSTKYARRVAKNFCKYMSKFILQLERELNLNTLP